MSGVACDEQVMVSLLGEEISLMEVDQLKRNQWCCRHLRDSRTALNIDCSSVDLEAAKLVFLLWNELHSPQTEHCLSAVDAKHLTGVLALCDFLHIDLKSQSIARYLNDGDLQGSFQELLVRPAQDGRHRRYIQMAISAYGAQVRREMLHAFQTRSIPALSAVFCPTAHLVVHLCIAPPTSLATQVHWPELKESMRATLRPSCAFVSECPICLEEFTPNDIIECMPCQHVFHDKCIGVWMGERRDCPLCRSAVMLSSRTLTIEEAPYYHKFVAGVLARLEHDLEHIDMVRAIQEESQERRAHVETAFKMVDRPCSLVDMCETFPENDCQVTITGHMLRKLPKIMLENTQQHLLEQLESSAWQIEVPEQFTNPCPPFGLFEKDPDIFVHLPFLEGFPWRGIGMKVVLGGGALSHCFTQAGYADLDFSFVKDNELGRADMGRTLDQCISFVVRTLMPDQWIVVKNPRTVSLMVKTKKTSLHFQFVMTLFSSIDAKLMHADLSCTALAFDGCDIHFTPQGMFSLLTGRNHVHPTYQSPNRSFRQLAHRLQKYVSRGFGVVQHVPSELPPSLFKVELDGPLGWRLFKLLLLGKQDAEVVRELGAILAAPPAFSSSFEDPCLEAGSVVAPWVDEQVVGQSMKHFCPGSGLRATSFKNKGLHVVYDVLHSTDWRAICIEGAMFYSIMLNCLDRQPMCAQDAAFYYLWSEPPNRFATSVRQLLRMGTPFHTAEEVLLQCPNLLVEEAIEFTPAIGHDRDSLVKRNATPARMTAQVASRSSGSDMELAPAQVEANNASLSQSLLQDDMQRESLRLGQACVDVNSAPAGLNLHHCLVLGTLVRVRQHGLTTVTNAAELVPGDVLVSGCGAQGIVRACRILPRQERDLVELVLSTNFARDATFCATRSHSLPVLPPGGRRYEVLCAHEVQVGSRLRTHLGEVWVLAHEERVQSVELIEIELDDARSSMYVSSSNAQPEQEVFVEVYGALAPLHADETVKLLTFSRFELFREVLLEGSELQACREDLERYGFSADMNDHDLGPGKMFVQPQIAARVLASVREGHGRLRASDIVVSRSFEAIVLEAIRRRERVRGAHILSESPIEVPHRGAPSDMSLVVRRTFLELNSDAPHDVQSDVTHSTSDVHTRLANPRQFLVAT